MSNRTFSGLVLIFLLAGMLTLAFDVQPVDSDSTWTETIYIRADGSIEPGTAPISTVDNITYTLTDNIIGELPRWSAVIDVGKDHIVVDGAGYTLQGTGDISTSIMIGVFLDGRSNVTVRDTIIRNFRFGTYISDSSNISVSSNYLVDNGDGIHIMSGSDNNTVSGNQMENNLAGISLGSLRNVVAGNNITNNYYGVSLDGSSENSIFGNYISNNYYGIKTISSLSEFNSISFNDISSNHIGIDMSTSSDNGIFGNNITANYHAGVRLILSYRITMALNNFSLCGLYVSSSFGNIIAGNFVNGKPLVYLEEISGATVGDAGQVILVRCQNITVENLTLYDTTVGVQLWETNNTRIINNTLTENWLGVSLTDSHSNTIVDNVFVNDGMWVGSSYGNVVEDNTVNGKSLVYLEDVQDYKVNDAGQVILVNCNNVTVENLNISNTRSGVQLENTNNCLITRNNLTANNWAGIRLGHSSSHNTISRNEFSVNYIGIELYDSSNNSIFQNSISANECYGINLHKSLDNKVTENTIANHEDIGIHLDWSSNNSIGENDVRNNNYGIYLYFWSKGNNIIENDISNNYHGIYLLDGLSTGNNVIGNNISNNYYGIYLHDRTYNSFFHNNLINNTEKVYIYSYGSTWDNGCEGNYWSNYNGTDSDGDGIGDTPYIIDADNIDNYPLMNPYWSPCDINHDSAVDMKDIGQAAKAYATQPGDTLWNPHADITGQEPLIPDGKVDMRDIGLIARNFGEIYTNSFV